MLLMLFALLTPGWARAQNVATINSGSTYTVPSNWNNSILREIWCFGAGGNGALNSSTQGGGGGAGGDQTFLANPTLTPNASLNIQIGAAGGTPGTTGATIFDGTTIGNTLVCGAAGGIGASGATGGSAGSTANDNPSANAHVGGAGGTSSAVGHWGGGGGSAANQSSNGGAGVSPGAAAAGAGGGAGGLDFGGTGGAAGTSTTNATNGGGGTLLGNIGAGSGGGGGGGFQNLTHTQGGAGGPCGGGGGGAGGNTASTNGLGSNGCIVVYYDQAVQDPTPAWQFTSTCALNSIAMTIPSVTPNDALVFSLALTSSGNTPVVTSVSATNGNTCFVNDQGAGSGGTTANTSIGHCFFANAGSTTITVSYSESGTNCQNTMWSYEYPPLSVIDVVKTNAGTGTTISTGNTPMSNFASDLFTEVIALTTPGVIASGPNNNFAEFPGASVCGAPSCGLFQQFAQAGNLLPQPQATQTMSVTYNTNTSSAFGAAMVAMALQATVTPTATPSATPTTTATATSTLTPTPSATATAVAAPSAAVFRDDFFDKIAP